MALRTHGYGILGVGMGVPEKVLTNADLEKMVDTTDEWITSRSGIKERHILADDKASSDMAVEAALGALKSANTEPEEIDLIICSTCTPDYAVPNTACLIQDKLGIAGKSFVFDINGACTGFLYALSIAVAYMKAGTYKKALVIGVETISKLVDYTDRKTCVLFGDGGGAAIVGDVGPGRGLVGEHHGADGSLHDKIMVPNSGSAIGHDSNGSREWGYLQMQGSDVFKFATRTVGMTLKESLKAAGQGLAISDIDLLFPHQANLRIIESAAKKLNIPKEKIYVNIERYGNTSSASIPIALTEAIAEGRLKEGDTIGMVAFGGGMTYGSSIWVW